MKKIICFGDSNTWGYNPLGGRYPKDVRWPGRMAMLLGEGYEVLEQGQNGRTIAEPDPGEYGEKAGINYVIPMLETEMPVDLLIIMLGSNDLKAKFGLPAPDIGGALQTMLLKIRGFCEYVLDCKDMKILIVAPPAIGDGIETSPFAAFFDGQNAVKRSKELAFWYGNIVAKNYRCEFFDASVLVSGGEADSLHLSPEGHALLAEKLAEKVREILG